MILSTLTLSKLKNNRNVAEEEILTLFAPVRLWRKSKDLFISRISITQEILDKATPCGSRLEEI